MSVERKLTDQDIFPLSEEDKHRLEEVDVEQDEFLFWEGDRAKDLFIVTEGRFALQKYSSHNDDSENHQRNVEVATLTTALLGPGDIIGLEGLLGKYSASAVADEPSKVIKLPMDVVLPIIQKDAHVAILVGKFLAKEVKHAEDNILEQGYNNVPKKVASALLKYYRFADDSGRLPVIHEQIAQVAGTARSNVTKTITNFAKRGYIQRPPGNKQTTQIEDPTIVATKFRLPIPRR